MRAFLSKYGEVLCVFGFIFAYFLASSLVSLHRFWQYNAFWYDFGIFDTTIWKLSQFHLPIIAQLAPPMGKIVWADHFNPSSILLSPFYWIWGKSEIVLIAQALVVSLSAFVAYAITRKHIKSSLVRISLIVSYLGFVGMQNALYTDVHNIVFATLPFMLTLWALYGKNWKWYWIFLFVTMGWQENLAGVVVGLGLFLLFRKEKLIKIGIATILVGLLYGIVVAKIIIPSFNGGIYTYRPNIPKNPVYFAAGLFTPPIKAQTIFYTFATFGFLPLATLATLPMILEQYIERFVLNMAGTRWDLGFHYNAILSPIMFLASLEFLIHFQKRKNANNILSMWAIGTIVTVFVLHRFILHGPLLLATHPAFYGQTTTMKFLDDFVGKIPTTGLLMTQNNIAAHFTHQEVILLHKVYQDISPDIVAIDIRPGQNANNFFPVSESDTQKIVDSFSANSSYKKITAGENQFIFVKKEKDLPQISSDDILTRL